MIIRPGVKSSTKPVADSRIVNGKQCFINDSVAFFVSPFSGRVAQTHLQLNPIELTEATVNLPYTVAMDVEGGSEPYAFRVWYGSLPNGLVLDGQFITGNPTSAGTFEFGIEVIDNDGDTDQDIFLITVK